MSESPVPRFTKPVTLRGRVEEYLRAAIMDGRLKGVERLREQELCRQLDISRPTLRRSRPKRPRPRATASAQSDRLTAA